MSPSFKISSSRVRTLEDEDEDEADRRLFGRVRICCLIPSQLPFAVMDLMARIQSLLCSGIPSYVRHLSKLAVRFAILRWSWLRFPDAISQVRSEAGMFVGTFLPKWIPGYGDLEMRITCRQLQVKAAWASSEASSYSNLATLEYLRCHGGANHKKNVAAASARPELSIVLTKLELRPPGRTSNEWLREREKAAGGYGWDARKKDSSASSELGVSTESQRDKKRVESVSIDQATLNGTRPNSPAGFKPAMAPSDNLNSQSPRANGTALPSRRRRCSTRRHDGRLSRPHLA